MRRTLREIRRAPARLAVTVLALSLAIAAIGVFAIPSVAAHSLRASTETDRIAHLAIAVADSPTASAARELARLDGVVAVEARPVAGVADPTGRVITMVGTREEEEIDRVTVSAGRLAVSDDEVVVPAGFAALGSVVPVEGSAGRASFTVVGLGGSSFWAGDDVAFATPGAVRRLAGLVGDTRVALRVGDPSATELDSLADDAVAVLTAAGVTPVSLPLTVPGGTHPIEEDIGQVSTLIGLLGVVAGIVALVLLGSTVTTLIAERSHEVAVLRALGSPDRRVRRRLRGLAMGLAAVALCLGLPLGVLVANVIARMVLDEFVGLTPSVAVSLPVLVGSACFALVGARLVSARAARRVTRVPLAAALRDRDGSPFGRRWAERFVARGRMGSLLGRIAARNAMHRPARTIAVFGQLAAAVAALMIVASLATTVNDFNASERAPWRWTTWTTVAGAGLDIPVSVAAADPDAEPVIQVTGRVLDWDVDVVGIETSTTMLDTSPTSSSGLTAGRWLTGAGEVVVSEGFAERVGIELGDMLGVRLASGDSVLRVVGLHAAPGRWVFAERVGLATELGRPGYVDSIASHSLHAPAGLTGPVTTVHAAAIDEDQTARRAILLIFGAIGFVVVAVAGLAVASGVAVGIHERRREFAALASLGGGRRTIRRVVAAELLPIALVGLVAGLLAGRWGAQAIIDSFESADAVEIGFTYASGAIPVVVVVAIGGVAAISALMVRRVTRRSVAGLLRGAT